MKKITIILFLFLSIQTQAAVFNIANGDIAALITAIVSANSNSEADVINLATNGVYNLSSVNNTISNPNIGGGNGLPAIINSFVGAGADVTINGNGATIQRNMAGDLRILVISGSGTEVVINNLTFKNAKATLNGACIAAMWQKVRLTLNGCTFENNVLTPTGANTEDGGGAILIHEGFLTVTNTVFKNNTAPNGGAIKCLLSNMTLTNCTFENNATTGTGNNGGAGVIVDGAFNDFSNPNTYNPARSIVVQQCKFLNNIDIKQGGGLFLYTYGVTNTTIDQCYFKGNTSPMGGGLWAMGETGGTCTITNTTFDSNVSSGPGGGITTIANGGQTFILNITNSTLAFNQANGVGSGGGGGLFNSNATVAISNSTIAKNSTNSFGGGIAGANSITIKNSIIADNTATNNNGAFGVSNIQRNCGSGGFVVSPSPYFNNGGNNLEWPIRTDLTNNGLCTPSMTVADPKLDNAVKDNGGAVPTLALLAGSAAINAGGSCTTTTDQRGTARVGACDIGAFEFTAPTGNIYYVDAVNGNNTFNGLSVATAKKTIQAASNLTLPGDIVYVLNGTYTNSCPACNVVTIERSGTASAYITYTNYIGHTPKLKFNSWNGFAIVNGAGYIKISGFEIEGNNASVTLAAALNQPKSCANPAGSYDPIYNGNGISADGRNGQHPHHLEITKNIIHDCGGNGVSAIQSDYIKVEDNIIYNNSWYTVFGTSGISIYQLWNFDAATGYHNFVRRNKCHNNKLLVPWNVPCQITDGNGIIIDDSKNTQNGSTLGAYNGRTLVENNICWYNGGSGIHAYESEHVDIINNTAYFNSQSIEIDGGEIFSNKSNDIKIYNNILYADNQKINTNWNNTALQYFNNLHFNGTTTSITDASCVNANPLFTNPTNSLTANFTIQVGSPAIDAGSATFCSSTDFLGAVRTGVCDIGAYQMVSPTTFPEIQVLEGATNIPDNTGTLAFGATPIGTPITKTLIIKNTGAANLTVSALTLPSGFAVVGTFPSSIAAATETTFQVKLNAATQGSFAGNLSFTNNDADENPFNFALSGTVTLAASAIPAVIATGTPKFSCGMTEAAIIAAGATKLTFGGSTYYIGTRQTTSINQDPVIAKFTAGVQDWCNQAYETTGADGRGNGLFWSGTDLYAIFSTDGTQGTVAQDYRRFTGSGWLKHFSDASPGGGGGPKVSILTKIDLATGDGTVGNGTFITALNSSTNKTNSLAIKDVYLDGSGNIVVRADSWFAPRKVDKTAMVQTGTGGSPHDYTLIFTPNLTTALCASAVGWNNGTATDCTGATTPIPIAPEIQVLEGLNDVADNTGSINFGATIIGTPITKTFTIKNLGTANLTLTAPTLPIGLSVVGAFPANISASADATFQISLTATAAGSPSGQISFANNDSNENPFNFTLSGTVTATPAPEIQVLEGTIDIPDNTGSISFGTTLTSTPITKTFIIKNLGTGILTLGTLSPLPAGFSLVGTFPTTLAASASTTFQIRLDAATGNTFTGMLSFVNDDADENPFNFTISGTVSNTLAPDIEVLEGATNIDNTTGSINFGTTVINIDIIKTLTIKNIGTTPLTLSGLTFPAGFDIIGTFPTSIAVGASANIQIYLDAAAVGSPSGTFSFANNTTTKNPFSLNVYGTITAATPTPTPTPPTGGGGSTTPVYVAPPITITAGQVTENQIIISWNSLPNTAQYTIQRRLPGQANFETVKTVSTNSFTDDSTLPAEIYEYRILTISGSPQANLYSNILTITTVPAAPLLTDGVVCGIGRATLIAQANTTKTVSYKWYEKENDANALQNSAENIFLTPEITQNTVFYVSVVFNGKESKKTAVNVVVKSLPTAKIKENAQISFCEKGILNAEKVEGATYRWLNTEFQEIAVGESLEVKFSGTYRLAVRKDDCQKVSEPINVIINSLPIAQILQGETVKFCRKGTIQAQIIGGLTYEWADEKGKIVGTEAILNLSQSGIYTLKTKQNGCESKAATIKVEIPPIIATPKITANKTTICEGETLKMEVPQIEGATYHWQGTGLFAQTRTVEIPFNKDFQNAVYQVYITKDGCDSDVASIEINFAQPIQFEVKMKDPNCVASKDGNLEILTTNEKLQFKINNQSFSNQLKINNLGKGEYTITAKNEWGCEQSQKVILTDPADFKVTASGNVVTSRFVAAQLNATGAVRYEWSPSAGLDNPNSPNPKANPLQTTVYTVKGYNENGCVRTNEVIVTILEVENIVTNKVLSPNNDGINDVWEIVDINKFPQNQLVVYNRWGQKVYEAQNYQNNWDGKNLENGTYYYVLLLPENKQLNGIITVER